MDYNVKEVAQRLKALREDSGVSVEEVAKAADLSVEEYEKIENGESDFCISFAYKCAEFFNVDMIEILTGENPKLKKYCVVRKGTGLPVKRREGLTYTHLAYLFKDKKIEPLFVTAPYSEEEQNKPISLSVHDGQEYDYILSGTLKVVIGDKIKELNEGDCVIYNSKTPHGMIAVNGTDCTFLAILIK